MEAAAAGADQATAACVEYLLQHHKQDLEQILLHPAISDHHSLYINPAVLGDANPELLTALVQQPKFVLGLWQRAADIAQEEVWRLHMQQTDMSAKEKLHVRLSSLPWALDHGCSESSPSLAELRSSHLHALLCLTGTVVRTGAVKMLEGKRLYECPKCKHRFLAEADLARGGAMDVPSVCPSDAQSDKQCNGVNFKQVPEYVYHTEYQEIRVQQRRTATSMSAVPKTLNVLLLDELVDACKTGDDVEVTGVLGYQFRPLFPGCQSDMELLLYANNCTLLQQVNTVDVVLEDDVIRDFEEFWRHHQDCPLQGRNKILASLCPQIYGLFTVKLATAVMLAGGVPRRDAEGSHIRGDVHMLIVGDPGTGKSQFMKFAAKVSPRSVMTTGKGSSGAGLTVSATKNGGSWMLEAGALVLADGGLCCIDEFDGIKEADRATLHEAMEQQTLSVAKAGMVTTLNTRTTVFAVTNPKGNYDPRQSIAVNTSLSGPLLSRFDILLVLQDRKDPDWDATVAQHILSHRQAAAGDAKVETARQQGWDLDTLRKYFHWIKHHFFPAMTPEAEEVLTAYYKAQRKSAARHAARTTIRMLESLVRLAQGHARLMARHEVTRQDAIVAAWLVEASMAEGALRHFSDKPCTTFCANPDQEYLLLERDMLGVMGLSAALLKAPS